MNTPRYITPVFLLMIAALLPFAILAQDIDETNIKKLERGEFKIEKGKIQVTFADTVAPAFVEQAFDKLGFTILSSNLQQFVLVIENDPTPEQVRDIEENKWVDFVLSESEGISDEELKVLAEKDSLDDNKVNKMLTQLNHRSSYQFVLVGLKYAATKEAVKELQKTYPDLGIKIMTQAERSAIIRTEKGKEAEMMEEPDLLPFVKSTAYIGSLE